MKFYSVIVFYRNDWEFVHLAASLGLEPMKQLAELICRHARPEISWVKIEDDDAQLFFYWSAATYGEKDRVLLNELPANDYIH